MDDATGPAAVQWPSRATLEALSDQATEVAQLIRDVYGTDENPRASGGGGIAVIQKELTKLTYLFNGRTLECYDRDTLKPDGCEREPRLAELIAGMPGPLESPQFEQRKLALAEEELAEEEEESDSLEWELVSVLGWPSRVAAYLDELWHVTAVVKRYFGLLVFERNKWWRGVAWLRDYIDREVDIPELPPDFKDQHIQGPVCRRPCYGFYPELGDYPRADLPDPPEIDAAGTYKCSEAEGAPAGWLRDMEHLADHLRAAIADSSADPNSASAAGELAEQPRSAPLQEGPYGHCQWVHNGELLPDSMRIGSWLMVKALYPGGTKDFTAFAEALRGDANDDLNLDHNVFGSLRRDANKFFKKHEIPLHVTVSKTRHMVILRVT